MPVLNSYAGRNGFTAVRYLGVNGDLIRSQANLGVSFDPMKPELTMNARYSAPGSLVSTLPIHAKGWPEGAMQHGEAFSLPAQPGDVVYDLLRAGELTVPGETILVTEEISQQDYEDCHFLWNAETGTSLWQHLKEKHRRLFPPVAPPAPPAPPVPPVGKPVDPGTPAPAVLSPAATRANELKAILLDLTKDGRFPATRKLAVDFWPIIKPFASDVIKTYRRLRVFLGDPRPVPPGE